MELQPEVAAADRRKAWSGQGECHWTTAYAGGESETATREGDGAPDWEQGTIFAQPLKDGRESLEFKRVSEAFLCSSKINYNFQTAALF